MQIEFPTSYCYSTFATIRRDRAVRKYYHFEPLTNGYGNTNLGNCTWGWFKLPFDEFLFNGEKYVLVMTLTIETIITTIKFSQYKTKIFMKFSTEEFSVTFTLCIRQFQLKRIILLCRFAVIYKVLNEFPANIFCALQCWRCIRFVLLNERIF